MADYDIITVGGGIGGSALAKAMAESGYKVLVVERETQFKDRVRGEWIGPWGVAEAKEIGVYDTLIAAGGHHPEFWDTFAGPAALPRRNFAETTPQRLNQLTIYHPKMQDALLAAAEQAGADVRSGARVSNFEPGSEPRVEIEWDGGSETKTARLVVGADGRNAMTRKWGGFEQQQDPPGNLLGGVLVEGLAHAGDASTVLFNPFFGQGSFYFPQGKGFGRAYFASRTGGVKLQGEGALDRFLEESARIGFPMEHYEGMKQAGPFATFDGADSWVDNPYKDGVALVGDAAATSDQTWGQGLSLTLRDVRGLRDELLANDDWDAAGQAYATRHDAYFASLREAEAMFTTFLIDPSEGANAVRMRVIPAVLANPDALPDTLFSGPELAPPTDEHRALFAAG